MSLDPDKLNFPRHSDFLWADRGDFVRAEANTSLSTGTPLLDQVTGTVLNGFLLDNADEAVEALIPIPTYWDRRHDVEIYVYMTCATAVTNAIMPYYAVFKPGEAIPTLVQGVVMSVVSASTSLIIDRGGTGASIIPASALNADKDDKFLQLKLAVTTLAGTPWFLGAELVYTPRWGRSIFGQKGTAGLSNKGVRA
jgi:hypothetical protein